MLYKQFIEIEGILLSKFLLPQITLLVFLCFSSEAFAKRVVYTFEEMVSKSSIVVVGKVQSVSGGWFRQPRAEVMPLKLIKGDISRPFKLYYGDPVFQLYAHEDQTKLEPEHKYILFITPFENSYRILGNGYYEIDINNEVCFEGAKLPSSSLIDKINRMFSQDKNTP